MALQGSFMDEIRKDTHIKAIVYTKYGPPDVLQLKEVDKPVPKDNEVLIRVYATTVTATDCIFRKGGSFLSDFSLAS
jgi:NADPH:quinone reductase-like Zn-dependent oxidoreductase